MNLLLCNANEKDYLMLPKLNVLLRNPSFSEYPLINIHSRKLQIEFVQSFRVQIRFPSKRIPSQHIS